MTITLNIGEAAVASGISAKMIRHYEAIGLIPSPARTEAGYRVYRRQDIHRLVFIHHARELGFSMPQIGKLLALWSDHARTSEEVKSLVSEHIVELESKINKLKLMKSTLEHLNHHCQGDHRPECPILDHLAGECRVSAK